MEKISFEFLIREDNYWNQVFSHIEHLRTVSGEVGDIAVVAIGTALLSCLQRTNMKSLKENISRLAEAGVQFYLCTNTMSRYGINEDMLLPEISVAREGGLLKAAKLETMGYHLITLG